MDKKQFELDILYILIDYMSMFNHVGLTDGDFRNYEEWLESLYEKLSEQIKDQSY